MTVAPCNVGTLQACISGAGAGDVVEIATNAPVGEDLTVDRSLTLRPAAGYAPTIAGNFQFIQSAASAATIVVDSLAFTSPVRAAPGTANLDFSLLNSTVTTSGSFIADPRFVSSADLHLSPDSSAIDRGSNTAVPGDVATDVEDNPRIQQARVDMGAYESPYAAPSVPVPATSPLGLLLAGLVLSLAAAFRLRRTG